MLAVINLLSVQMITLLGGDVKPLALSPYTSIGRGRKRTYDIVQKRVGDVDPGVIICQSVMV